MYWASHLQIHCCRAGCLSYCTHHLQNAPGSSPTSSSPTAPLNVSGHRPSDSFSLCTTVYLCSNQLSFPLPELRTWLTEALNQQWPDFFFSNTALKMNLFQADKANFKQQDILQWAPPSLSQYIWFAQDSLLCSLLYSLSFRNSPTNHIVQLIVHNHFSTMDCGNCGTLFFNFNCAEHLLLLSCFVAKNVKILFETITYWWCVIPGLCSIICSIELLKAERVTTWVDLLNNRILKR